MLAPGVLGYVEDMLERQELSKNDAHARFLDIATKVQRSLNLPLLPNKAWKKLARELS